MWEYCSALRRLLLAWERRTSSKWGVAGWAADIVPHAVYGAVTAVVFDSLSE